MRRGAHFATLAIGAGAMTASHINDGLFPPLARHRCRPATTRARLMARFSLGTALQGAVALAALILLRLMTA